MRVGDHRSDRAGDGRRQEARERVAAGRGQRVEKLPAIVRRLQVLGREQHKDAEVVADAADGHAHRGPQGQIGSSEHARHGLRVRPDELSAVPNMVTDDGGEAVLLELLLVGNPRRLQQLGADFLVRRRHVQLDEAQLVLAAADHVLRATAPYLAHIEVQHTACCLEVAAHPVRIHASTPPSELVALTLEVPGNAGRVPLLKGRVLRFGAREANLSRRPRISPNAQVLPRPRWAQGSVELGGWAPEYALLAFSEGRPETEGVRRHAASAQTRDAVLRFSGVGERL
mmetsp:Transcript_4919/g.19678  ORF Transcript_4919/g.19678 Transcript_4919/m.19678 type:complete len:285 (+) Transcript_4919:3387-4241(+)